ncbi:hypothetical protein DWF00_24070 [Bosea caraganae]|uniref:Uncharacterized protein n=1 Tax=Bosea caraganae TaxID=2763117 RepID=A0A370L4H5_9HYPH|nr:hypothetical protein [Bosea caraganae]RDJ22293.1 hypothetical protein DWF00_24070 [Bosea caraganae]RDJ23773.1 hypothetical protein DWE98_16685 [Bosea caraganae]
MLARLVIATLLTAGALAASALQGHAFWKRSHWDACNDAPTEAERTRLKCWIFEPVDEFPAGAIGVEGWYGVRPFGAHRPGSRGGGPVVRRLG